MSQKRNLKLGISVRHMNLALMPFIILSMLTLYQNCSKFKVASVGSSTLGSSGQCFAKDIAMKQSVDHFRSVQSVIKSTDCDELANYHCEARIFSPDIDSQSETMSDCSSRDSFTGCLAVTRIAFNTSGALSAENMVSFEEGQEYNRTEFRCAFKGGSKAPIVLEGESLDSALSGLHTACLSVAPIGEVQ